MKLLVAIDFSSHSEQVLVEAERLAEAMGAIVWLFHVAEPDPDFVGYGVGPQSVRDSVAERFHKEHQALHECADLLRERGVEVHALLKEGATVDSIIKKSQELQVTYIIMGTHGHGSMYNLLLGSVSDGVIRRSCCPVVLVPSCPQ